MREEDLEGPALPLKEDVDGCVGSPMLLGQRTIKCWILNVVEPGMKLSFNCLSMWLYLELYRLLSCILRYEPSVKANIRIISSDI